MGIEASNLWSMEAEGPVKDIGFLMRYADENSRRHIRTDIYAIGADERMPPKLGGRFGFMGYDRIAVDVGVVSYGRK